MSTRLSFRGLIIILFVGGLILLLVMVGLLVFRLQQAYLLDEAQDRLISFVEAGVAAQFGNSTDLTFLAYHLAEDLRVLGADMFIQDASGNPVPPSLGTGPWLTAAEHQAVRDLRTSRMQMIGSGATSRIVYLVAVVDQANTVLGSVEASLSLAGITGQLDALRRWLTLIITLASILSVLVAVFISGIITRPIKNLVSAVERVRQGDLQIRAPISEVYELGELAITYNHMLDRISNDLRDQALQAENMRRFAADASHELRSPLSVFRNSVELLDKAYRQNDHQQLPGILAMLRKEVDSMTGLVENLLLLARLDQSEAEVLSILNPDEVDPLPLLEEVYERSLLLAQGQQVDLVWPACELKPIWADREMVRRALNNVVENAIIYTPAGKKITLSMEMQDEYCCFVVEDQGIGIAPDQVSKILDRFYRTDESRNRKISGTGLGLAIVAAIVEVHGGKIQVDSQPNEGTRIKLMFKRMASIA